MMHRLRRVRRSDTGASAVEFALVSTLLLMLVFGIVQYGYYFFQMQSTSAAAREAARLAAVGVNTCSSWLTEADARAAGLNASKLTLTLTFENNVPVVGKQATVVAEYVPERFGFPFVPLPSGNINQTAKIRVEQASTDQNRPTTCSG